MCIKSRTRAIIELNGLLLSEYIILKYAGKGQDNI